MSVAVDATGTEQTSGSSSTSLDYTGITVGSGSNSALILMFSLGFGNNATGVTATWDNAGTPQAMTLIKSAAFLNTITTYVYGLRNPIAGNKTLHIAWTNVNEISACAISFTGVDQTSDATAFPNSNNATGSSAAPSINITSALGNIPVTSVGCENPISAPNQTQIYADTALIFDYGAQRAVGAASVTFNWTAAPSGNWVMAGCDVAAAAVVSAGANNLLSQIWM